VWKKEMLERELWVVVEDRNAMEEKRVMLKGIEKE
jgi:hypothetical protein